MKEKSEIRAEIAKGGREVEEARWWTQCLEAMRRPSHFWENSLNSMSFLLHNQQLSQPSQLLGIFTRGKKEQHGRGFQQITHRSWHKCTGEDDARSVCHFCGVYCQADLAQLIILPIV